MPTWDEIKTMTDEEIAVANKRLVRKFVIVKIIAPVAAVIAVHVICNVIIKKLDQNPNR